MFRQFTALLLISPLLGETISYNEQVRPILSDKCFLCHGPDVENNKAGLRLDRADSAYAALEESSGHAIVPGSPEASVAWKRMLSTDQDEIMPPPDSNLSLSGQEKEILKRWIEQGAVYEAHWAFVPLRKAIEVPTPKMAGWVENPIDAFVLDSLESDGLKPNTPAADTRWLRRVTLDLTGLPPSSSEIEAFKADGSLDRRAAKEAVVERLLHSPAYGEHMASAWLDAARYADSYGYQSDQLNHQWPYRDWVIRAFNSNLPYDQFATWQIAGDVFDQPSKDQELATAFNRLHRLTNEGGSIREEWMAENAADRVHTFGTAFLALTLECSRCHDHKYDPISAHDYYALSGFFNSIDENGLYDSSVKIPAPAMLLPTDEQTERLKAAQATRRRAEADHRSVRSQSVVRFIKWLEEPAVPAAAVDLEAHYDFTSDPDQAMVNLASGGPKGAKLAGAAIVEEGAGRHLVLDGDHGPVFPGHLQIDRWSPFSIDLTLHDSLRQAHPVVVLQKCFGTDVGYNGFDLMLEDGHLSARLYRVWPGNGIGVRTQSPIELGEWTRVTITYDGSSKASGLKIHLNGKPAPVEILRDHMQQRTMIRTHGSGHLTLGQRFRDRGFQGGGVRQMKIYRRELSGLEIRHEGNVDAILRLAVQPGSQREQLLEYFQSALDAGTRAAAAKMMQARKAEVMLEESIRAMPVMRELPEPRETHVLARGEYDAPTDESTRVERDTPKALPPLRPRGSTPDRLDLARWLTQPDHPLTARVFVNRMWANFFGRGLVSTADNFGLQGSLPTHPDLLDWLARDLIAHGWDIHHLCRRIALSNTYAQDSSVPPDALQRDPENQRLARGPAHRLAAEQIRDTALKASGLMDPTVGGPPVSPYQPGGDLWRESNSMSPAYRQSTGKALHRRSIYSVWKRTAPLPNMSAFDAPTREVCTVSRPRTNTPLQALVMLNDVQFVEAARALATAVHHQDPSTEITAAFVRLAGRPPSTEELNILIRLHGSEMAHFTDHPEDAAKLIAQGESPAPSGVDPVHLAATTSVCLAILNLDATLWKR